MMIRYLVVVLEIMIREYTKKELVPSISDNEPLAGISRVTQLRLQSLSNGGRKNKDRAHGRYPHMHIRGSRP
jgi:hypothetical protein